MTILVIILHRQVRQGESEGWITELGPRPGLQSYRASKTKLGKVSKEGSIQLGLLSTPTSQRGHRADPVSPTTIPNAGNPRNSSTHRAQSQILIRVPGKSTQYLGRRATDVDGGGGLLRDFGESEIMGDQAGAAINERARERERRTHHVRPSDTH